MAKDDDFYPRLRVVKMTSFLLKYAKEGELRVAGRCTYHPWTTKSLMNMLIGP
jgi:hypothetical protein